MNTFALASEYYFVFKKTQITRNFNGNYRQNLGVFTFKKLSKKITWPHNQERRFDMWHILNLVSWLYGHVILGNTVIKSLRIVKDFFHIWLMWFEYWDQFFMFDFSLNTLGHLSYLRTQSDQSFLKAKILTVWPTIIAT